MIDQKWHQKEKERLKKQFEESDCLSLWHEHWDQSWVTSFAVVEESINRAEKLLKCDDLTAQEKNFITMVESWT